jgi:hypothetical protein
MASLFVLPLMFAAACVAIGINDWRAGDVERAQALLRYALILFGLAAFIAFLVLDSSEPDLIWCNAFSRRGNQCTATMRRYQRVQHEHDPMENSPRRN